MNTYSILLYLGILTGINEIQCNKFILNPRTGSTRATITALNNGDAVRSSSKKLSLRSPVISSPYSKISQCTLQYVVFEPLTYVGSVDKSNRPVYECKNYGDTVTIKSYTGYLLTCHVNLDGKGKVILQLPIKSSDVTVEQEQLVLKGKLGIQKDGLKISK